MDIRSLIANAVDGVVDSVDYTIEHPQDEKMGDYSTNVALVLAKSRNENPRATADWIMKELLEDKELSFWVEKMEVAGPGFINFYLRDEYFKEALKNAVTDKDFGKNQTRQGEKVMIEFTDPNPFKVFHIGHLMSNTIGESISRLIEFSGALVTRVCYQGDVGIHVAKSIWGARELLSETNQSILDWEMLPLNERAVIMGKAYARGAKEYDEGEEVKRAIDELNKVIYQRTSDEVNQIYDLGRKWSLDYFEQIYRKLGTKFDDYYFESQTGVRGTELVKENLEKGIFEESQGAVIFPGEKYGLHTRVFINSMGLPTYEAKELGLAKTKYEKFPYDLSIIVTANEINEYFKVLIKALSLIYPDLASKTEHIGHGMLKLKYGKMSSRTGNVVSGEGLLDDVQEEIKQKMKESGKMDRVDDVEEVASKVAVGAVKYSLLKQSPGKDILFDFDTSLSFEGDSGPYLQYSYARAVNIIKKHSHEIDRELEVKLIDEERKLIKWMARFPELVEVSAANLTPNLICSYLIELCSRFNYFYTKCQVIGSEQESFRVEMVSGFANILKNGLWVLGIEVVEKM